MRVLRSVGVTSTGRRRRRNEDAFVNEPPLFAVADGMGGPRAGEVASGLAAAAVKAGDADGGGVERVVALIQEANRRVYERSSEDANVSGMGTTMTIALVEDGGVVFGHVGDSRAYLVRDGVLEQLTQDHSLVAELVRGGKLSPEEAEHHPQRSVITRALGTDPDVDVDTFVVPEQDGDIFLICSDGLTTMIGDDTIERVVAEHGADLEGAAEELVRLANKAGGEDNITVVAFEVSASPPEPDERTLEQTQPMPVVLPDVPPEQAREPAKKPKRSFWPLLLLLLVIAAAAVALWLGAR